MNLSNVSIVIIAAALVGCGAQGASQTDIGVPAASPHQQASERGQPARGDAFSGSYTGRASGGDGCSDGVSEYLVFQGRGKAAFLHRSRESGTLVTSYGPSMRCLYSGSVTLSETKDRNSTVTMTISGSASTSLAYAVTAGTGRFAKATGHGVFTITLGGLMRSSQRASPLCCQTYYDEWSGKLKF